MYSKLWVNIRDVTHSPPCSHDRLDRYGTQRTCALKRVPLFTLHRLSFLVSTASYIVVVLLKKDLNLHRLLSLGSLPRCGALRCVVPFSASWKILKKKIQNLRQAAFWLHLISLILLLFCVFAWKKNKTLPPGGCADACSWGETVLSVGFDVGLQPDERPPKTPLPGAVPPQRSGIDTAAVSKTHHHDKGI